MSTDKIKIFTITDSPKSTSGFGNVARMILQGFHDSGMDVYSFGTMDHDYDLEGKLPYKFFPSNPFDEENGTKTVSIFLVNVQPDIIFMLFDPGSAWNFINVIEKLQQTGNLKECPIVLYTPIEGIPVPMTTAVTISKVLDNGGRVVTYSPGMIDILTTQFPQFDGYLDYAYHGLDHANFRQHSEERRNIIRKAVGVEDTFVVGSVGVNKRTKGFDTIIYTARCLKDMGVDDVKFYLHTSPDRPTMWGYNLIDLAKNYGVEDYIIFKPEVEKEYGGNIKGVDRESKEVKFGYNYTKNLAALGFIDRINMFDCYLDLSSVEGWGLPAHEAMRCGVPTISVHDHAIRDEIYDGGVLWIDAEPFRTWTTWHTGVKLVLVDPMKAAEAIIELKNSDATVKKFWSDCALRNASKYNWKPTQDKMVEIVKETVRDYEMPTM